MNDSNINVYLAAISAISAVLSVYYASKSIHQNTLSQMPILEPEINDVSNPQHLSLLIKNIGNGIAKNITGKIPILNYEQRFDSDLYPRKFQDYKVFTWDIDLPFQNGGNPLFVNGELFISYEDVGGKKYQSKALFKPDVIPERKALGHIDKNFSGTFYNSP